MATLKRLYDMLFKVVLQVIEMDVVPDFLLRMGIRYLLGQRYKNLVRGFVVDHDHMWLTC